MTITPKKKLSSILGNFEKIQSQLSVFLESNAQEMTDMKSELGVREREQSRASKALGKLQEFFGD